MKPLVIIEEAELDVVSAHAWYEQQRPGLGDKCLAELRAAIGRVHTEPHAHPHIEGGIQRLLVRRFPYVILYRDEPRTCRPRFRARLRLVFKGNRDAGRGRRDRLNGVGPERPVTTCHSQIRAGL